MGCSPWGRKESDMTEQRSTRAHTHTHTRARALQWLLLIHHSFKSLMKVSSGMFLRLFLPTARLALWSLPQLLGFFQSRRCPPAGSAQRAPGHTGPSGQSSWVFLTRLFCSPGLDDAPDGGGVGLGSVLRGLGGRGLRKVVLHLHWQIYPCWSSWCWTPLSTPVIL